MDIDNNSSLLQLSDRLVSDVALLNKTAKTEEELRIGFEKLLSPLLSALGIKSEAKYERLGKDAAAAYKGRPDAVHGMVIIEYEKPNAFSSQNWIKHAHEQLVDYISAEAKSNKQSLFIDDPKYVGVGFDGFSIFFTKYNGSKSQLKSELNFDDFGYEGPYEFNNESARTFLTYIRSLSRKPLTAEHLAEVFGPKGNLASTVVSAFADSLEYWGKERVRVFFNEWKRLFGIVYGEQFNNSQEEEVVALSSLYKVGPETDFQELLFSVHTYFALLMKLIVAELISLKDTAFNSSYSNQLTHASKDQLLRELIDVENGGVYAKRGITNFLEGDFFSWYLDAWSPRLEEAIREMTRQLSDFEPATTSINPESTRDLLKKLYQYLVPQEVRHKLGEYYTPDWLAELLLDEVGYNGDSRKRFLDPACGSGTFLVLAIQRVKENAKKQKEKPLEVIKRIVANIWGFDLNPLAVIASRTNYLFALGDLINEMPRIEIPIYLADSVLWPQKTGQLLIDYSEGENVSVQTSVGLFHVPQIWVRDEGLLMKIAAPMVEDMARNGYSTEEALKRFKIEGVVFAPHEDVVKNFYGEILDLEKQGKDGIWARFLKNAFAPMTSGKFDFVVGNPPWIRWGYLSDDYRKATLAKWKNYELFSLRGNEARLGGGEKDFSMLFTYAASDYYLSDEGKLGFLITQEVFKSKGAGEGFRRFKLGKEGEDLKVIKALDFVTVQPFEGATNKTAAIILKKGAKTEYPVPYFVYSRKKGIGRISPEALLKVAKMQLNKEELIAKPMGKETGSWQTLLPSQKNLSCVEGLNAYQARRGASADPYGVFWMRLKQVFSDGSLLIENLVGKGKREVSQVEQRIESDLVFPAITGADIQRWGADVSDYLLMTQDPNKSAPIPEDIMKNHYPRTYSYLTNFKQVLLGRGSKVLRSLAEKTAFYAMFGIGTYTVANYKVVWKRMASDIIAAVISQYKSPFGYKTIIPTDTTALIAADTEDEAHYLCAILNSNLLRDFISSYSSAGRGFGAPSVMENVGIPKYNSKDSNHKELSDLSKQLHNLKLLNKDEEIAKLEKNVDEAVNKLFGMK